MGKYVINGGKKLYGDIHISGAKNAAVAIIPAAILAQEEVVIENVPNISDVETIVDILRYLGAEIEYLNESAVRIDTSRVVCRPIPKEFAHKLRASYYLLGILLARFHEADVGMPGGCNFGERPFDLHLKGFELLGSDVRVVENGGDEPSQIIVHAQGLTGAAIYLGYPSVGATINIMLASVKAQGLTIIDGAAREPHIVDLANFLNSMGADVRGAGTDVIKIRGVDKLHGCTYSIIPDQIEAGTYMVAAAACGGDVTIRNVIPKHLESISAKLRATGVVVIENDDVESIRICRNQALNHYNVKTNVHPGFPTDMQPQITALLTIADGESKVAESVWEKRFQYIGELNKMGAHITMLDQKEILINGVKTLHGAEICATDLRAGAAMVIAGMSAQGKTVISNIQFIERGYEKIIEKLRGVGADITKIDD